MAIDSWVVAADEPGLKNVIAAARGLGGRVGAIVVGERALADTVAAGGVDQVVWFPKAADRPAEAYAGAVGAFVQAAPRPLLAGRHGAERVVLAAAAAAIGAPVFAAVEQASSEGTDLVVRHLVAGGAAEETVLVRGPAVLLVDGGGVPEQGAESAPVERHDAEPNAAFVVEATGDDAGQVDLASAKRVIGVGRGLKQQEDLHLVEELARVLGAEIGCSRPLAEGLEWLPRDRYLGISGQHIAPRVYLAVGISGQLQHMDGVHGAQTIVAINTDAQAPITQEADYVLVGDLYSLVPALTAALS